MVTSTVEQVSGAQALESLPTQRTPGQFEGSVMQDYLEALGQWVTHEGMDILDEMFEGVEYRRLFLDIVFQHWYDSRSDASDALGQNPATKKMANQLDGIDYRFSMSVRKVGDQCLPDWEKLCRLQLVLADVYGISLDEQLVLNETIAQQWVERLGTTTDILSKPEYLEKLHQEVEVQKAYLDEYERFKSRYWKQIQPIAGQSTTPGTTRRTIFRAVLYTMYDFDPRKRQALLAQTTDPIALELQERLYQEEAELVQAAVAEQLGEQTKTVDLSKYL